MIASIVTRLQGCLPDTRWAGVAMAEDLDAVGGLIGQVASGTAIVMPYRERAEANAIATGGFRQRVMVQFLTVTVLRNYDQAMGGARAARFDKVKADIEAALAGWMPPDCIYPCELVDGESSPFDKGVSFYVHTWQTQRFLTGAQT